MQAPAARRRPEAPQPTAQERSERALGRISLAIILGLLALSGRNAAASEWPDKPVKIVIPFAAGGATDLLGRALANELGKIWKQSVVVDNRPGAGGALGAEVVAKSPSDGYTLLLASGSMFTVNPHIYSKLPYSTRSFELITKVASGPMVVTVNSDLPARNMQELIAYAKANPAKVNFASAGNGSQVHMAGESFADATGIDITHIAYKGEGPAYADLLAGVVQMAVGNINAISPLLKTGKIRALAVTGKERVALLPEVPTVAEAGLSNYDFTGWFALVAPASTPTALTDRIDASVRQAVAQPGMKRYLAEQGMTATLSPKGKLGDEINNETERWKVLVSKRKISAN
ncbi:LacI family transcriptional regulator [Ramlibacter sp. Leaf400]|nr:LacI family transcriptional regulator [Ramlibacter sp. Leaf400]